MVLGLEGLRLAVHRQGNRLTLHWIVLPRASLRACPKGKRGRTFQPAAWPFTFAPARSKAVWMARSTTVSVTRFLYPTVAR